MQVDIAARHVGQPSQVPSQVEDASHVEVPWKVYASKQHAGEPSHVALVALHVDAQHVRVPSQVVPPSHVDWALHV